MQLKHHSLHFGAEKNRRLTYLENSVRDVRLFLFVLFLLCLYRVLFIAGMPSFIEQGTTFHDILQANVTGMRLSLKSAGGFALLSFVFVTLTGLIHPRLSFPKIRLGIGAVASLVLAVLFVARFPYYQEFHATYGMQIMQGFHDDKAAILGMIVSEYGIWWRLPLALVLAFLSYRGMAQFINRPVQRIPSQMPRSNIATGLIMLVVTVAFALFARFGGGYNYATGINWENAAVTSDSFLNECILDDIQGIYRGISFEKKMRAGDIYGVEKDKVVQLAQAAATQNNRQASGDILSEYLMRETTGAKLAKPRHIFIVLGESWAQWPMLEKYADLHVADGIKSLAQAENGYYTPYFMPNGDFTSVAITGMITGLSEVNIRANYQPRSFKEIYPTAMAPIFQQLGYQVDFWYGGTPGWDNIERLAMAQGFNHFYGYPDFHAEKTNSWGTKDGNLFAALEEHLSQEPATVHVVMTTSNHPPYNVDLAAEGFDLEKEKEAVRRLIPDSDADTLATELGHYWYMDKVVTDFVKKTMEKYPDSLFVITGDHAVRTNPGAKPTMFEFQSVPFVLYGAGVTKSILPQEAVGGHTSITPTLVDLLAPKGFSYASIAPAIGEAPVAFNRDYYLTNRVMGKVETEDVEALPYGHSIEPDNGALSIWLNRLRTLSWQLLEHGDTIH